MKPLKKDIEFNYLPGGYLELSIWIAGTPLRRRFMGYSKKEAARLFWMYLRTTPAKQIFYNSF